MSRPALPRPRVLLPATAVVALLGVAGFAAPAMLPRDHAAVSLTGVPDHALLGAAALDHLQVRVHASGISARGLHPTLDGRSVPLVPQQGRGEYLLDLGRLPDGPHTISVAGAALHVTVDATPPKASVALPAGRVPFGAPVHLTGSTGEPADQISAPGGTVTRTGANFSVDYPLPPSGAQITVTDPAGNSTVTTVTVPTTWPAQVRAVHVTGYAWAYAPLREPVLQMLREHRLNAVELDIKDEDGMVNFASGVPMAAAVGAEKPLYDAGAATAAIHALGGRVIGRVVSFKDPTLSRWAWANGHPDWDIQRPDGSRYTSAPSLAGWTDFAQPAVRGYLQALAVAAVRHGFDDVVFDYFRRPDGPIGTMHFPGLSGTPEQSLVDFLAQVRPQLHALGAGAGVAAFGQAATRPHDTAQDIPQMARQLDFVVPMDYPSHWHPGEYGVADPNATPGAIVQRSLVDWVKDVQGTDCVVVPWLQDENYGGSYPVAKVAAQIAGARADGLPGWFMWSAGVSYQAAAYSPDAAPLAPARR